MSLLKAHPPPLQKMCEGSLPALLFRGAPGKKISHDVGSISSIYNCTFHFDLALKLSISALNTTQNTVNRLVEMVTFQINGQIQLEIARPDLQLTTTLYSYEPGMHCHTKHFRSLRGLSRRHILSTQHLTI